MNAVVFSVLLMLTLSLFRVNVVIALVISSLCGGMISGMSLLETINHFNNGLGGGATIALNYAMLGAFAVAIAKSGITDLLALKVIKLVSSHKTPSKNKIFVFKSLIFAVLWLAAIMSQNLVPIHIAFIPILIPPLLQVLSQLNIDRRAIACILTFGLTSTYMLIPSGFGAIFLNDLLHKNLVENGLLITTQDMPTIMAIPVFGMFIGLVIALSFSYRKKRHYQETQQAESSHTTSQNIEVDTKQLLAALVAIVSAVALQLYSHSIIVGSLAGLLVFIFFGVIKVSESQDVFVKGLSMMAMIGFIMIAASGFAEVMKASQAIDGLIGSMTSIIGDNRLLAVIVMLLAGLLITMGIGSSFSTIPIIAAIYVPMALAFDFSVLATAAIVGTAAALGDAGSPASDSTLGPTSGLNADGQHDHIWDTVVPTFIHFNIPLVIFGTIAAMVL